MGFVCVTQVTQLHDDAHPSKSTIRRSNGLYAVVGCDRRCDDEPTQDLQPTRQVEELNSAAAGHGDRAVSAAFSVARKHTQLQSMNGASRDHMRNASLMPERIHSC